MAKILLIEDDFYSKIRGHRRWILSFTSPIGGGGTKIGARILGINALKFAKLKAWPKYS